jgi:hypothetical protein
MVDEQEEKDVTQVKVPNKLVKKIREADNDYKLITTKDLTIIALNHFLYELQHRKKEA